MTTKPNSPDTGETLADFDHRIKMEMPLTGSMTDWFRRYEAIYIKAESLERRLNKLTKAGEELHRQLSRAKVWDCDSEQFKALELWQQAAKEDEG